jgi:maltooligosyltrehalose trehalohydrolase
MPIGAEIFPEGIHLRVWAAGRQRVQAVIEGRAQEEVALAPDGAGYFLGWIAGGAGTRYRFRLDGEATLFPDPASRFQPEGPHGPSEVIDPASFAWTDAEWRGVPLDQAVIYEMHIGTFTPEGTWQAAMRELPALRDLGVTVLELMPVAEFPGRFGWGYDGVDLFAPTRLYGRPDDMRRFVDRAHALGLAVILDVVYNHLGPDGNYLKAFSGSYFTDRYECDWGEAVNFDGPGSGPVREFYTANAACWIGEVHLDGLRLDATQQIFDSSAEHVLVGIGRAVRRAAGERITLIINENEPQHARLVRPPERGGYGLDAMWNDDFHHSAMVALTGRNEAYYSDYLGSAQELLSCAKWGFLYQGQRYMWQGKRRGTPCLDLPPAALVNFLQNHDQVANSMRGLRGHRLTSPGRWRAMIALSLLMPGTPMLFQGQEFAASTPFCYFADHKPELAALVAKGRAEFLRQFPAMAVPEVAARLRDPADPGTFEICRLDHRERAHGEHAEAFAMHQDLLRLRRGEPALAVRDRRHVDGAVLGPEALVLRYFGGAGDDRILLVNLGRDLRLDPAPEPLLAPPEGRAWTVLWSSEDPRYGGCGTTPPESEGGWRIPGHAALVLCPGDP